MTRAITAVLLFALASQAHPSDFGSRVDPGPRTFEQKIQDAQLIVLGTASSFGDKHVVSGTVYEENVSIEVKDVIWPPSFTNRNPVVFPLVVTGHWGKPLSTYSNFPGIFFLTRSQEPAHRKWDRLGTRDDWIEPLSNALPVLLSLQKLKGKPSPAVLPPPEFHYPEHTRYDTSVKLRLAYLAAFRDGYYDALLSKHGLWTFNPATEEDKAKVAGYADGQLSGDSAREDWYRKLRIFLKP